MATTFYIPNSVAQVIPATIKGAWNATPSARAFDLSTIKYGDLITSFSESEVSSSGTFSTLILRAVSSKLAAQTISGDVNVIIGTLENLSDADFYWHIHTWVTVGDTDTVRGTLVNNYTETGANEWSTTAQGRALQFAFTMGSVVATSGDRIVFEIGFIARNVTATSRTGTIWIGTQVASPFTPAADLVVTGTDVSVKAGSITFTDDITFEPVIDSIIHAAIQVVEGPAATTTAQIAHAIIQLAEIDPATAEIAHMVVQCVEGLPVGNISGIYFLDPDKAQQHDSYYGGVNKKIPDPTIRTALVGE